MSLTRRHLLIAALLVGAWCFGPAGSPAAAQAVTLETLLRDFRQVPGLHARFQEEKQLALMAAPLPSAGQIWFTRPGELMRRVERPDQSAALIAEGRLRMRTGGRIEEISIADNPVLRGFVDSFRAVLAGDLPALERFYNARITGTTSSWELTLTPRDGALRRFLSRIVMRGSGTTIREMVMTERNGDVTTTTFSDVRVRSFSAADRARIFRIR